MKVKVSGDTKAQILNGIEPWEECEIEVPVASFPSETRELLLKQWRPVLPGLPTPEAVVAAFVEEAKRLREQRERFRQEADSKIKAALTPTTEVHRYTEFGVEVTWVEEKLPFVYLGDLEMATPELAEQYRQLSARLQAQNKAAKEAAYAEKAEAIKAARDAAVAESKRREEERKAAEAKRREETRARRAEIRAVEIEITRDDPRKWGEPWGAVVRGKEYDFSAGTYDPVKEIVTIKCAPGDVIAWGQKNYQNPRKTIKQKAVVLENWDLKDLD
jgi:hypothetical protein